MGHTCMTLLEKENGYKIVAVPSRDLASHRVSVNVFQMNPKGECSTSTPVKKSQLIAGESCLSFIYDWDGNFGLNDLMEARQSLMKLFCNLPQEIMAVADTATPEQMYECVIDYIVQNDTKLIDIGGKIALNDSVFTKNGFGFIETKCFSDFMEKNKDFLGLKRKEILLTLKLMDVLIPGNGRAYDRKITVNGRKGWYYQIKLPDNTSHLSAIQRKINIEIEMGESL